VSFCRLHHDELHTVGRKTWRKSYGLDLRSIAEELYRRWCQ
jgi:hypothetical protein